MHRASILISLGLGLTACTAGEGDEGIFLAKNVAPSDGCSFSASAAEDFIVHGTSSVFGSGYVIYPQLVSKITATEATAQQRTIQLRGARVDIETTDPDLSGLPSEVKKFESRFSAPLLPNGGITDAAFVGIPGAFLKAVREKKGITAKVDPTAYETEVIVHAVVFGDLAGSEVTSQSWEFPVTITSRGVTNIIGMCPVAPGTDVVAPTNACSAYQDGTADCCAKADGDLACPPTVSGMQYALTVSVGGGGNVKSTPAGIDCGPTAVSPTNADCGENYAQGTMVTLTQTPLAGGTFTGWTGGGCVGTGGCTVTMDAAKTVMAAFNP